MSVEPKLASANNLLKGLVAIVAFFPGIAVYLGLVEVPPDLVGTGQIVSFSISIMVLICIPLFSDQIAAIGKRRMAVYAFLAVILGAGSLVGYLQFAKSHIVSAETATGIKKFIIPLRPSPEIQEIIAPIERPYLTGRYKAALEVSPRREELKDRLTTETWGSFIVMIVLLLLSQVLLVAPPVAAVWRLASAPPKGDAPPQGEGPATPAPGG